MIPNFQILGRTFSVYMIIAIFSVLLVLFYTYRLAKKKDNLDEIHMLYIILFSFFGSLVGAHLLYGITNISLLITLLSDLSVITSFSVFIEYMSLIFGGAVFYGGLIGALITSFIYLKKKNLNMADYSDAAAPAIPLFHAFGRIGCFLSGCCYGVESNWGFIYHHSIIPEANNVVRFPIQLVESAFNFILFFFLFFMYKKNNLKGKLLLTYLFCYCVARFILEFFRGDDIRGHIGLLSTSQIISILIFIACICFIVIKKFKKINKKSILR